MAARMRVKGTPELRARLRAIKVAFRPIGRQWAQKTRDRARPISPIRSGRGRRSIRVKTASQKRASVVATYYMAILDRGSKAHTIVPRNGSRLKFTAGERTVFARKVNKPAARGLGFGARAGRQALRETPMAERLIELWNGAA